MSSIFKQFDVVVIDSSIIFISWSDDLLSQLTQFAETGKPIYTYPSFDCEVSQLLKAEDYSLRQISESRMQMLSKLPIVCYSADAEYGIDLLATITKIYAAQTVPQVALISGNYVMNAILAATEFNTLSFIHPSHCHIFNVYPDQSTFFQKTGVFDWQVPNPITPNFEDENSTVSETVIDPTTGVTYTLSNMINNGREAEIYQWGTHVLKIFKQKMFTDTKRRHIQNLINLPFHTDWLVKPLHVVYDSQAPLNDVPVGYVMNYITGITTLSQSSLFSGNLNIFKDNENQNIKPTYVAEICIALVRQVLYLHMHGILIGDYNTPNFAIHNDNSTDEVIFFDADSFAYLQNPVTTLAVIKNRNDYDINNKLHILYREYDYLCLIVLHLFTLGIDQSIEKDTGEEVWRFAESEQDQHVDNNSNRIWQLIPLPLQQVFRKVQENKENVLPAELLYRLLESYPEIAQQKSYYQYLFKDTPIMHKIRKFWRASTSLFR